MDFSLNETQQLLQDSTVRLIRDRYTFEQRKQFIAQPSGYSQAMWSAFAELGLLGIEIAEQHGGSGGTFNDLSVVLQAFGAGLVVEPMLSTVVLAAGLIQAAGDDTQMADHLPKVAAGELLLAVAYEEAQTRYRLERIAARARQTANGYVVNGAKSLVLGADAADALIVAARTDGAPGDRDGISLFLIPARTPGITLQVYATMDDRRAGELTLENVEAPASSLIGELNGGLPLLQHAVDRGATAVCCDAVGAMAALNELTLDYIKTRQQFGRPIGKFQVLQHRMADMMMAEQQAKSMCLLALDAIASPDASRRANAISAAKVQISNSAREVGRGSIQLHGGIGMTMEYVAGHYFRRLTALEKMFGDIDFHLERYAIAAAASDAAPDQS